MADHTDDTRARLGVVMLDHAHLARGVHSFVGTEEHGIGVLPEGFFESPRTWGIPVAYTVADGALPRLVVDGDPEALAILADSVATMAARCDLVVTSCGFFHGAWGRLTAPSDSATILSSLDLLGIAEQMTAGDIFVLTWDETALRRLLGDRPASRRLRTLELRSIPEWAELELPDFVARGRWDLGMLQQSLQRELARAAIGGATAVVLECTLTPQFRSTVRQFSAAPIIDIASVARMLLA
jgi:hypothetical protein